MTKELEYPGMVSRGNRGKRARQVQEWLSLHGEHVSVDGAFGPASQAALRKFQSRNDLTVTGTLTRASFDALTEPMRKALEPLTNAPVNLGAAVIRHARAHLKQHPREIGGQNRGPWVRLYMDGHEGNDWPWCAGFVCFVLKQACASLDVSMPFPRSFSCDVLAGQGKEKGIFVKDSALVDDPARIGPGAIFLKRRTATDWTHTGIVSGIDDEEVFSTVEGNTNDEGSREGYEVCARTRGFGRIDFLQIG